VYVRFAFNWTPFAVAFTGMEKIIAKPIARNMVSTEIKLILFLIKHDPFRVGIAIIFIVSLYMCKLYFLSYKILR
jgi:hypothetical protein